MQKNDIILFSDGEKITSDMLRSVRNCATTGEYFCEPDLDYSAIMLGDKVNSEGLEIALAAPSGVLHPIEKIPIREYFFRSAETPDHDDYSLDDNKKTLLAARAHSLLLWREKNKFCPACGGFLSDSPKASSKTCQNCRTEYFPRLEPCVIVRLTRGNEILLARHTYRNQDLFTCIAGFIEAGETAENAVRREVFEETHLTVKNIKYIKSQAWPFPDQLMLAFSAEYEAGEIALEKSEIAEAGWFSLDSLPATPRGGSVAYSLIHGLL